MIPESNMLTVFIGSSSEAKSRGILSRFVVSLGESFDVRPWDNAFETGSITIQRLLAWTKEIDAAICIFSKDDVVIKRDQSKFTVRDNVLFEYGLFLAILGTERVFIAAEEGTEIASDLEGVTSARFKDGSNIEHSIQLCCNLLRNSLTALSPLEERIRPSIFNDKGIGISKAIAYSERRTKQIIRDLSEYCIDESKKVDNPFYFESHDASLNAYKEGLNNVKRRFWTTTFLTSGFWLQEHSEASVIRSNKNMLRRLHESNGDIRRLFVIDCPISSKADQIKNEIIRHRQEGNISLINKRRRHIETLKQRIQSLEAEGTQVRVVYDRHSRDNELVKEIKYDPIDSELAIYDDHRLDVFTGGSTGRIYEVYVFSDAMNDFHTILESSADFFSSLWNEAVSFSSFIVTLEEACRRAERRIDYRPNWLAKYQYGLEEHDERLKTLELARVKEVLSEIGIWGKVTRLLDIGTCTGRYMVELRDAVINSRGSNIIGLDEDEDCIHFASSLIKKEHPGDRRLKVIQSDFLSNNFPELGKFDLITCMLGTLAHFGWDRDDSKCVDSLQDALVRMCNLLADNGILVLGTWSNYAISHSKMLSIYSEADRNTLSQWSPPMENLERRLSIAGFCILNTAYPEERLTMYFCQKNLTNS
jgi:SAM-dependent methyltransferase